MKTCPVCDTPFPDQHATCPTDGAVLIESRELTPSHIVRNKYRIIRKLGQGGMGVVYLAEHSLLGGQVALKFLAVELSKNPQFVKRFRNEARAAYQLRHPNIVEVTDLDQDDDGTLFIAMEYIQGSSLRNVLRETKSPLPVKRAIQIVCDVAAGLAAAHARGAVHRDIKPENILVRLEADGKLQAKVLDFGIAAMTENITNLSRTHGLLLTPEYAAPEQWRGTPATELDGRTDLYALGGVLYELLTGQTPFHAVNPEGWMFQHLQGVPHPLSQLRPDVEREHPGLEGIVMRLLAREREQRFPSATALLEALAPKPESRSAPLVEPVSTPQPRVVDPPLAQRPATEVTPLPKSVAPAKPSTPRNGIPKWIIWVSLIVVGLGIWLAIPLFRPKTATAVPILTPRAGTYTDVQSVEISDSTPQSTIHYTVDGSTPTEASPIYEQPLRALPNGTVVRAIATAKGYTPSSDITGVYIWSGVTKPQVNPHVGSVYDKGRDINDHVMSPPPKTITVSSGVMQDHLLVKTVPQYPAIAKEAHIQGTVVLQAKISKTGIIEELHVVSGPPLLCQAAMDGVKTWRYRPYLLNGVPVEVETQINVVFNLRG